MDDDRKKRACALLYKTAMASATGLGYLLFVRMTGIRVPCIFYTVTGIPCPGCGVTRMCIRLASLDFTGAYAAHPGLFSILPVIAAGMVHDAVCHIYGKKPRSRALWTACLIWITAYDTLRILYR